MPVGSGEYLARNRRKENGHLVGCRKRTARYAKCSIANCTTGQRRSLKERDHVAWNLTLSIFRSIFNARGVMRVSRTIGKQCSKPKPTNPEGK